MRISHQNLWSKACVVSALTVMLESRSFCHFTSESNVQWLKTASLSNYIMSILALLVKSWVHFYTYYSLEPKVNSRKNNAGIRCEYISHNQMPQFEYSEYSAKLQAVTGDLTAKVHSYQHYSGKGTDIISHQPCPGGLWQGPQTAAEQITAGLSSTG